jgi:hypothetical protein
VEPSVASELAGKAGVNADGGGLERGRGWNGGYGSRIAARLRELGERLPAEALSEADRDALRELSAASGPWRP